MATPKVDLSAEAATRATAPASVSTETGTVRERSAADQREIAAYANSAARAKTGRSLPFRLNSARVRTPT
ncbi:MAG: hypothetical protein AAFQ71_11465 [Planctomycetota bacterium]